MTAQRLVRGGKARIVLGICAVLLVLGAIFHHENIVSDYENLKKRFESCTQQSESLSTNLQGKNILNVLIVYINILKQNVLILQIFSDC